MKESCCCCCCWCIKSRRRRCVSAKYVKLHNASWHLSLSLSWWTSAATAAANEKCHLPSKCTTTTKRHRIGGTIIYPSIHSFIHPSPLLLKVLFSLCLHHHFHLLLANIFCCSLLFSFSLAETLSSMRTFCMHSALLLSFLPFAAAAAVVLQITDSGSGSRHIPGRHIPTDYQVVVVMVVVAVVVVPVPGTHCFNVLN